MNLLLLDQCPIQEQLRLEEHLLRRDDKNYCLINTGTPPAIVMGISGKADTLVHLDQLPDSIPVHRRFSGGGTVIVDENTLFITFIRNRNEHDFPAYPEPILRWACSIFASSIPELKLRENDFVLGEKKCGGNALYIKKDRWLIHTSFLWDYDPSRMSLLKYPPKTPSYRAGRSHTDFICRLSDSIPHRNDWIASFKNELALKYQLKEVTKNQLAD